VSCLTRKKGRGEETYIRKKRKGGDGGKGKLVAEMISSPVGKEKKFRQVGKGGGAG